MKFIVQGYAIRYKGDKIADGEEVDMTLTEAKERGLYPGRLERVDGKDDDSDDSKKGGDEK